MKRIVSLILLLSLLLSLSSCGGGKLSDPDGITEEEEKENAIVEKETGEITYPDSFAVGYGTSDISGNPYLTPTSYYGGTATGVHDPLMLTCIAIWDGEEIALIMTADLKKMLEPVADRSFSIIKNKFGIPEENIILSCTHTHAAPDAGQGGAGSAQWLQNYYKQLPVAVEAALRDLDPVDTAFTGKADQPGIGFVRRYLLADGTWKMNPSKSMNPVEHESEADPEMRTIRFDRKNKKDVLLVNFQTHYYGANKKYPGQFSADFVAPFRKSAEKEFDCLFAYYSGASGDINQNAVLPTDEKVPNADDAFMDGARKCLKNEEKIALGNLKIQHSEYTATCKLGSPEKVRQAQEVSAGKVPPETYGFESVEDASYSLYYGDTEPTKLVPFTAIAFGDVAFVSASYEMFHQSAQDVRSASPFQTTFVCTLAHAANGYVPTAIGYEHGGYETWNCRFAAGSGEKFAEEMIRLLNACKK